MKTEGISLARIREDEGNSAAVRVGRAPEERCRSLGGVFTLLWHNGSLVNRRYALIYSKVLDQLVGREKFDWRNGSKDLC